MEVVTASNGFDAIEKMTQSITGSMAPIDMIFMDVQMPRMSGLEAALEIRKIERAHMVAPVPIIALTAHGLSDEKDRLVSSGLDDYVGKPVGEMQLIQILQKWLERSGDSHRDADLQQVIQSLPEAQADAMDAPIEAAEQLMDVDWQDALTRSAHKPDLAKNSYRCSSTAPRASVRH